MTVLDIVQALPGYQENKADIHKILKLFSEAGIEPTNDDSLILSRLKPFFEKLQDASQALHFLENLKVTLALSNKFVIKTPQGRAIRLLDSSCEISSYALLNVSNAPGEEDGLIDLHTADAVLLPDMLVANKIYLDTEAKWAQIDKDLAVGAPSPRLAQPKEDEVAVETVIAIIDADLSKPALKDPGVDFNLINNYINYVHMLDSELEKYLENKEVKANFIKEHPLVSALPNEFFVGNVYKKILQLSDIFLDTERGIRLMKLMNVSTFFVALEETTKEQGEFFKVFRLSAMQDAKFITRYLNDMSDNAKFFSDDFEDAPDDIILQVYPQAESLHLLLSNDYLKYPAITLSRPDIARKIAGVSSEEDLFNKIKTRIINGEISQHIMHIASNSKIKTLLEELKAELDLIWAMSSASKNARSQLRAAFSEGVHTVQRVLGQQDFPIVALKQKFLPKIDAVLQKIKAKRHAILHKIAMDPVLMQKAFNDSAVYTVLCKENCMPELYKYSVNKDDFANAVLKNPEAAKTFPPFSIGLDKEITYKSLAETTVLSAGDEYIAWHARNIIRHEYNLPSLVPVGALYPRSDSVDEVLSKEDRYQLEGADMAVGENYLRVKYSSLFINKVAEAKKDDGASLAGVDFFFLPIGIIHSNWKTNVDKTFRDSLRDFVNEPKRPGKPLIFVGVANVNRNHYVPYFIFKNKFEEVYVVTVDPSPQAFIGGIKNRLGVFVDGKDIALMKLADYFKDVFPGCRFIDPNVTQQLRQRDCGVNTLQTIEDVLMSADTNKSVISIANGRELQFKSENLTINGNFNRGFNYDLCRWFYYASFKTLGQQNRRKWSEIFKATNKEIMYVLDKNSIDTIAEKLMCEGYAYEDNVNAQELMDEYDETLSLIAQSMLADTDKKWSRIKDVFDHQLIEPSGKTFNELVENVANDLKTRGTNIEDLLPAGQKIDPLVRVIMENNLYDKEFRIRFLVPSITIKFKAHISKLATDIGYNDSGIDIVGSFERNPLYKKFIEIMTEKQKKAFRADAIKFTDELLKGFKKSKYISSINDAVDKIVSDIKAGDLERCLNLFNADGSSHFLSFAELKSLLAGSPVQAKLSACEAEDVKKIIVHEVNAKLALKAEKIFELKIDALNYGLAIAGTAIANDLPRAKITLSLMNRLDAISVQRAKIDSRLQDVVDIVNAAELVDKYKIKLPEFNALLSNSDELSKLSLVEVKDKLNKIDSVIDFHIIQYIGQLFALYEAGDALSTSAAKDIRPVIAILMGDKLPAFITPALALEFDKKVKQMLFDNDVIKFSAMKSGASVVTKAKLPRAAVNISVPDCHNKPLTCEMLLGLLEYWDMLNGDPNSEKPKFIGKLINYVNKRPVETHKDSLVGQPLAIVSDYVIQISRNYSRVYDLPVMNPEELVVSALLGSSSLRSNKKLEYASIETLEKVVNYYFGLKVPEEPSEIFAGMKASEFYEGEPHSTQKTTFFGYKSNEIERSFNAQFIMQILLKIRLRHKKPEGNFDLNYPDLLYVSKMLKSYKPGAHIAKYGLNGLESLESKSDKFYWTIACIIATGFRRMEENILPHQLLEKHAGIKIQLKEAPSVRPGS